MYAITIHLVCAGTFLVVLVVFAIVVLVVVVVVVGVGEAGVVR